MADEAAITDLHRGLLDSWNEGDAAGFAELFTEDGSLVGFDGTMVDGRGQIGAHLSGVFGDHEVASYVGKVRSVRHLSDGVAVLQAVAGMVPPGQSDINPATNAVQVLVAVKEPPDNEWRIAVYQNTPAQFHGRPEAVDSLTEELRAELLARAG
ncbi:MAG: SgcJ/EcaC family oxidoreductase [Acidimicrobiales bacterium]|nr:SgcJ/EcaC family oxidoreductase [Acidimicrobiales bacterium]